MMMNKNINKAKNKKNEKVEDTEHKNAKNRCDKEAEINGNKHLDQELEVHRSEIQLVQPCENKKIDNNEEYQNKENERSQNNKTSLNESEHSKSNHDDKNKVENFTEQANRTDLSNTFLKHLNYPEPVISKKGKILKEKLPSAISSQAWRDFYQRKEDAKTKKIAETGKKKEEAKNQEQVSFGSSKGSMVETLIYESPLQEESEPSPIAEHPTPYTDDLESTETEREKVRVSFFQQSKPQEVDLPDEPIIFSHTELMMAAAALNDSNHVAYIRQESTESGWDNPFRPGGDLSREADEIVELIKGGKPITPTSGGPPSPTLLDHTDSTYGNNTAHEPITESPKKATALNSLSATPKSANGNVKSDKATSPGAVDVQRGTLVPAGDASQVEHVVIKKKPKCECCVIQ
ncbi:hypothetical protein FQR65_LT18561 [Abscondita terminalis]|nr:hypothetical protein FQR65_LT18561 [Abscondita terminalis]